MKASWSIFWAGRRVSFWIAGPAAVGVFATIDGLAAIDGIAAVGGLAAVDSLAATGGCASDGSFAAGGAVAPTSIGKSDASILAFLVLSLLLHVHVSLEQQRFDTNTYITSCGFACTS